VSECVERHRESQPRRTPERAIPEIRIQGFFFKHESFNNGTTPEANLFNNASTRADSGVARRCRHGSRIIATSQGS
jgi:hypothetical protein